MTSLVQNFYFYSTSKTMFPLLTGVAAGKLHSYSIKRVCVHICSSTASLLCWAAALEHLGESQRHQELFSFPFATQGVALFPKSSLTSRFSHFIS